jgi:peptidoglycan/LPS O-acetylase OafA/YrhL
MAENNIQISKKTRLLFFDLMKILGVFLILLWHMYFATNKLTWFLPVYGQIHLGNIGIFIFLIASGAALTYNHDDIKEVKKIFIFYYNRFVRIYPAFWVTIFFTLMVTPGLIPDINRLNLFEELTGFYCYFNNNFPFINNVLWFVGLIVILYLIYPILVGIINKYGIYGFIGLFSISIASHFIYLYYNNIFANFLNPLTYLTFGPFGVIPYIWPFVLGIYIIKSDYYPKTKSENIFIIKLSDLSFYIYLVQGAIFPIFYINILLFFAELLFSAYAIMLVDTKIQHWLKLSVISNGFNSILKYVESKKMQISK